MTCRQAFNNLLIELNKVKAPSILLEDFNYLLNKAIYSYINKRYNIYDISQQTTDDLRVLKATASLNATLSDNQFSDTTYEVIFPDDYFHILNCICIFKVNRDNKCYSKDNYVAFAAKRLTADAWSQIFNDYYNRPIPERPYYYINNVNTSTELPTNPLNGNIGTDMNGVYNVTSRDGEEDNVINLPRTISINGIQQSTIEKQIANRYGNPSKVRCEIRCGKASDTFSLAKVNIDYLKTPQFIRLTPEQMDLVEDTSQVLEFPDYVCQEIINELVTQVMSIIGDPRLSTHIPVSQSIANPAQTQPSK